MQKPWQVAACLCSLVCALGALGQTVQQPDTEKSAAIESWRQLMMQPRTKQPGCYQANYPDTKWHSVACDTAPAPTEQQTQEVPAIHPADEQSSGDYVAISSSPVSSATGTLSEISTEGVYGVGPVPNQFSIQLNTNLFPSSVRGCESTRGCLGWQQFVIDSGGSIQVESWLLGYLSNPDNIVCPRAFVPFPAGSVNCRAEQIYEKLPMIYSIGSLSGVSLTGEADSKYDNITMSLPDGFMLQGVMLDNTVGLAGNWKTTEFNVFGNSNGEKTYFTPGSFVAVQLELQNGTTHAPDCVGGLTYTAETSNLVEGPCTAFSSPLPGIRFEEAVPPVVNSLIPNFGPTTGGTAVTVYGQGFTQNMEASFGGKHVNVTECTPLLGESYGRCTIVSPAGTAGAVDVTFTNLDADSTALGYSSTSAADLFTYKTVPYGSMSTSSGVAGTYITVTGMGFSTSANAVSVSFDVNGVASPAVDVQCSSTTTCTMIAPALPASAAPPVEATVSLSVGGKTTSLGSFLYEKPKVTPKPPPPPPPCHGICM